VVREINKFSNNVMAQQLFLTLALQADPGRAGHAGGGARAPAALAGARTGDLGAEAGHRQRLGPVARRAGIGAAAGAAAAAGHDSPGWPS
jgi:hypothetical protein